MDQYKRTNRSCKIKIARAVFCHKIFVVSVLRSIFVGKSEICYTGEISFYIPEEGITLVVCSSGVSRFRLGNKAWVACRGQSLASKNIRLNINDTSNEEFFAAA
jgi:hypothetical protein